HPEILPGGAPSVKRTAACSPPSTARAAVRPEPRLLPCADLRRSGLPSVDVGGAVLTERFDGAVNVKRELVGRDSPRCAVGGVPSIGTRLCVTFAVSRYRPRAVREFTDGEGRLGHGPGQVRQLVTQGVGCPERATCRNEF